MPASASDSSVQIPFLQEFWRKTTHMIALVIPGGYVLLGLNADEMLAVMVPIAALMIAVDIARLRRWRFWTGFWEQVFGRMIRPHEKRGDFTGATYILATVCVAVALFDKPIAVAALSFIIVGDTFAALVGRRWGRHRIGAKSVEGSLACLVSTLVVAVLVPNLAWPVGLIGAVCATVVEALPLGIDDNVSVPLLSGLAMTLSLNILATS